ncbi:hypothetical protein VT03_01125 [Planctomyces sp. SH-PL14]|nr:hypothetical protein VT03_01125 [Planctomyces sp. SH-PL14]
MPAVRSPRARAPSERRRFSRCSRKESATRRSHPTESPRNRRVSRQGSHRTSIAAATRGAGGPPTARTTQRHKGHGWEAASVPLPSRRMLGGRHPLELHDSGAVRQRIRRSLDELETTPREMVVPLDLLHQLPCEVTGDPLREPRCGTNSRKAWLRHSPVHGRCWSCFNTSFRAIDTEFRQVTGHSARKLPRVACSALIRGTGSAGPLNASGSRSESGPRKSSGPGSGLRSLMLWGRLAAASPSHSHPCQEALPKRPRLPVFSAGPHCGSRLTARSP